MGSFAGAIIVAIGVWAAMHGVADAGWVVFGGIVVALIGVMSSG